MKVLKFPQPDPATDAAPVSPLRDLAAFLTQDGGALRDALPFTLTRQDARRRDPEPIQPGLFKTGVEDQ